MLVSSFHEPFHLLFVIYRLVTLLEPENILLHKYRDGISEEICRPIDGCQLQPTGLLIVKLIMIFDQRDDFGFRFIDKLPR